MSCKKQNICCCNESSPSLDPVFNLPGKDSLSCRVGTFHTFFDQMKKRISTWETPSGRRSLAGLSTRELDDPCIAFMDAWAVAGDVITFYQERIANEGYIRTAEEKKSLLELARQIGYELKPGVSAATVICWMLDESASAPDKTLIQAGTQIQSIPEGGDLPQVFETHKDFTAYKCWNKMTPRMETPTDNSGSDAVLAEGIALSIRPGDAVLIEFETASETRIVKAVREDEKAKTTRVFFKDKSQSISSADQWPGKPPAGPLSPDDETVALTQESVKEYIYSVTLTEKELEQFCDFHEWNIEETIEICRNLRKADEIMPDMFHYGEKVSFYGAGRPRYLSLPSETRHSSTTGHSAGKAYPYPWDEDTDIWFNPSDGSNWSSYHCFLEREIDSIAPGQRILLRAGAGTPNKFEIEDAGVETLNSYSISAKTTGLNLKNLSDPRPGSYSINGTRAWTGEQKMTLAAVPLGSTLDSGIDTIILSDMVAGLSIGQTVVLTGMRTDTENLEQSENLTLKEVQHSGGYTRLIFKTAIKYSYERETLSLNANVTDVTHGERVSGEVVGSSKGEAHQRFVLNKTPLTWINSGTASGGAQPTLEIRVNGISWKKVDYFYDTAPEDEIYTIRMTDKGDTIVQFGDGIHGAVPPAGINNITADYRTGIGSDGLVDARAVSLVKTRPYGVKDAFNPVASDDAEDPEARDDARINAPRTVRTLDRIVSLTDYEDYCRTYAGIGKAQAVELSLEGDSIIHISVLSSTGDDVSDAKLQALNDEVQDSRDSTIPFIVDNGVIRQVTLKAGLIIDDRYEFDTVKKECSTMLAKEFSFKNRMFGQGIDADDVIRVLHDHEAVIAADIDALSLCGGDETNGIESYVEAPGAKAKPGLTFDSAVLLVMPDICITLEQRVPAEKF